MRRLRLALTLSAATLATTLAAASLVMAGETPAPDNAKAYFINLKDGDKVASPVLIRFGLSGMGVAPSGTEAPNTGHHHLLIDAPALEGDALNEAIPVDAGHVHFGKGQTEASVNLTPGQHTLQLVLGDWSHIPHNKPVMSERITITVEPSTQAKSP
ncbi:DUF4399 domain-containing protein [Bradyrhizobium sp. HKCCYLRH3099]|uniref:DUF4399 domain-containing protein n=1 Tax=unclassified Bradyrhizobium TaxID=2631580 RepID=UPI003EB7C6EE